MQRGATVPTKGLGSIEKFRFLSPQMAGLVQKAPTAPESEAALYPPVKRFLEGQGYTVKGEIRGCDLVACRGAEPPVVVELKRRFSLALLLQGIDRLALTDSVYVAVPRVPRRGRGLNPESAAVRRLCRRLGLGLMLVGRGGVTVIEDPVPYRPRPAKHRVELLLGEFVRRRGDMNIGGSRGVPIVTAYRQDALRCACALAEAGALHLRDLRRAAGVADAASILQRNVYGWFERVERGTYALTEAGEAGLARFAEAAEALAVTEAAA
jgi:hypothetical protein